MDFLGGTSPFRIISCDEVKEVRPYIVGCLLLDLDIKSDKQFRNFITLQVNMFRHFFLYST